MARNYYETLGISRDAPRDEIKKAYKRLAKQYHPDLNKDAGAAEKLKEINEAASVLCDDKKRANYDRFGTASEGFTAGTGGFDFRDFSNFDFDFDNIFDSFFGSSFGRAQGQRRMHRGSDLNIEIEISLKGAAFGVKKRITLTRLDKCAECNGSGSRDNSLETCPDCNGRGVVKQTIRTPFGMVSTSTTCRRCSGQGRIITNPCKACDGRGRVKRNRKLEVEIPAGIEDGSNLRIAGEGEAGEHGAPAGDLYIRISIKPDDVFERQGNDVWLNANIPFTVAALGGSIKLPTLDGEAELKIPAGTQAGTVFRMRGNGIGALHGGARGSQNVRISIAVPESLSRRQRELLLEFEGLSKSKNYSVDAKKGFFDRIKGAFNE